MPHITLGLGVLLILLGLAGYLPSREPTAMIPMIPGGIFFLLGALALWQPTWRKHLMHAAVALSLLVALLMVGMLAMAAMAGFERPQAAMAQAVMALLCLGHVAMGVRSFAAARRARSV